MGLISLLGTTANRSGFARLVSALLISSLPLQSMAEEFTPNVFFGFDMVLTPIALKGACGGDVSGDVARIDMLMSAYPDAAQSAGIPDHLEVLRTTAWAQKDPTLIIGNSLLPEQMDEMCRLASALTLDWLSPSAPRGEIPQPQQDAWGAFFALLESL